MTTKQFLKCWLRLVVLLMVLIPVNFAIYDFGAEPIARYLSPPYVPLSAAEEQERTRAIKQIEFTCNDRFGKESHEELTKDCIKEQVKRQLPDIYASSQAHEVLVIDPMKRRVREVYIPLLFSILYLFVLIPMLISLWKWMSGTAIPCILSRFKVLKSRVADESILWSNRKMSTAVKHLDDLENLFERGMITKEVLEERKAEIKKALAK